MIRFFRNIRQRLLKENKLGKYLLYALGEIILVVIGILIAVNINNSNEYNKRVLEVEELFNKMLIDINTDIGKINNVLTYYHRKDSLIYLILNDKFTKKDYLEKSNLYVENVETSFRIVTLRKSSYTELLKYSKDFPDRYKPLLVDLEDLYTNPSVNIWNQRIEELNLQNSNHRSTYEWYSEPSPNESLIDYCVNDPIRKNKVKLYYNYATNHRIYMIIHRRRAIALYKKIATLLDKPMIGESFKMEKESIESWVGNYIKDSNSEIELTIVADNNRLFWYSDENTTKIELYPFTKTKSVSPKLLFNSLIFDGEDIYLKGNDYTYKKVKNFSNTD